VSTQDSARVVVLTALPVEYRAVRAHLRDRVRRSHPTGTEFEVGVLPGAGGRVAIAELGQGTIDAALAVSHAVELFRPGAILFVGIAGALHDDLRIGDVVVAVRVYAYQSGTVSDAGFLARPRSHDADRELEQRARVVARDRPDSPPVYFRPVAAGDVVLNSRTQPLSEQLERHYNDAGAIEMESAGMVRACHVCRVPALVVRGISDRADGAKEIVDAGGSQPLAARNAADFAVAVITDFLSQRHDTPGVRAGQPPSIQIVAGIGAPAYGAQHGNVHVHEPDAPLAPDWRTMSRPPPAPWREQAAHTLERAALELHLIPAATVPRIEVRRLPGLADVLAGLLPPEMSANPSADDLSARAVVTGYESGPRGLLVSRDGVRYAWGPLPSDKLGSIFDEDWVTGHLTTVLTTLVSLDLPRAARYAPAVAISKAWTVILDRIGNLPRTRAATFGRVNIAQVLPEESLPVDHIDRLAGDVAAELAARLAAILRRR
jgi:nucleoside phosphorylase